MAYVTKRGKKWSVRYRVEDPLGNETCKRISGFASKEEAWEQARILESASQAGVDVHGAEETCGAIMERWFSEHCLGSVAKTTLSKYSDAIERLKETGVYDMQVKRVTKQTLPAVVSAMENGAYNGRPIARNSAIRHTEPLRFALSWAEKNGLIQRNPLQSARLPSLQRRQQRILNTDDIDAIVSWITDHPFKVPILIALYGGLRREEVAALKWSQVDFEKRTLTITEAHTRTTTGQRIVKDTKTQHSSRTVSMPRFVLDELKALKKSSIYVCAGKSGVPYRLDSYPQAIRRIIQQINAWRAGTDLAPMPAATFHDLRHTHAAMLIKMGIQPKVIQERLGHASIKITMDTYGYLMPGLQESVASMLDAEFQAQSGGRKSGREFAKIPPKTRIIAITPEKLKAIKAR